MSERVNAGAELPAANGTFARHETFHFRYGWLKKGVDAVAADPTALGKPEAIVRLGVGKNMVQSIRYWCLASRLIRPIPNTRGQELEPTPLARLLLLEPGFDPYLERSGTLWLIHWLIAGNKEMATTWYWFFSVFNRREFNAQQATKELKEYATRHFSMPVADGSYKKDIQCLLRMYLPSAATDVAPLEENLDCPLTELRLLESGTDGKQVVMNTDYKPSLPAEIVGFAIARRYGQREAGPRTVAIDELVYEDGSPGRIFKLTEPALCRYLDSLMVAFPDSLAWDDQAGIKQVFLGQGLSADRFLTDYYQSTGDRAARAII